MSTASRPYATPRDGAPSHRLRRTFSGARFEEYDALLSRAARAGYTVVSLESWLLAAQRPSRALILRHDVDQCPNAVAPFLEIEQSHGVTATWYFRWRTAVPRIVEAVRGAGGDVGLHYETLTRLALSRGLRAGDVDDPLIAEARALLNIELAAFSQRFGPTRSACPHGDTRAPGVLNRLLLEGQDATAYGLLLDGNAAIKEAAPAVWATDRTSVAGRWKEGADPLSAIDAGAEPILLLTHPNNWCSGRQLWSDRAMRRLLPRPAYADRGRWTGSDTPPPALRRPESGHPSREFAPVADGLRREIARFEYDRGRRFSEPGLFATLETNAGLVESRAAYVERALESAGSPGLAGRRVLDVGCGFGALALLFAARGADVVGVDPDAARLEVGATVASRHGLSARFVVGTMEQPGAPPSSVDVVIVNNALCYTRSRSARRRALRTLHDRLVPGGLLLIAEPNRFHPRDRFSGVLGVNLLPQPLIRALRVVPRLRRRATVRIVTAGRLRRELRRAGFIEVASLSPPRTSRPQTLLAGYHQTAGRRALD